MLLDCSWKIALAACLSVGAGAACSSSYSGEPSEATEDAVIGGVDAKSAKLDAVGSLLLDEGGWKDIFCTGALIAPTVVLTAKHCALERADPATGTPEVLFTELGTVSFAIGADSSAPKREVKAKRIERARLDEGGFGYGADVAVYILEEPITDITPLPVAQKSLDEQDLGKPFVAIGFGVRDRALSTGVRTLGNITLSSLSGKPYQEAFATYEDFVAGITRSGATLTAEEQAIARAWFDRPLLYGYEAFFAARDGDAQPCSGDSGGPLLRKIDGKLTIFGVASWVPSKTEVAPCSRGVIYATFGASARELIEDATSTACAEVPVSGRCEGAVAVRCVSAAEGVPRVTKTNCEDVDQTCQLVDGKAACVDR